MGTYNFFKKPVTTNLRDPRSKAEEPDQPFRLVSPMSEYDIASMCRRKAVGASQAVYRKYVILSHIGPGLSIHKGQRKLSEI